MRLINGHILRLTENSSRGGEHEMLHPVGDCRIKKRFHLHNVIFIVLRRLRHRLRHINKSGEMNYSVKFLCPKHLIQKSPVAEISFHKASISHRLAVSA